MPAAGPAAAGLPVSSSSCAALPAQQSLCKLWSPRLKGELYPKKPGWTVLDLLPEALPCGTSGKVPSGTLRREGKAEKHSWDSRCCNGSPEPGQEMARPSPRTPPPTTSPRVFQSGCCLCHHSAPSWCWSLRSKGKAGRVVWEGGLGLRSTLRAPGQCPALQLWLR